MEAIEHVPFSFDATKDKVNSGAKSCAVPIQRTQNPIITGSSVIAFEYDEGVIIAADNLGSYGSLARFRNEERLLAVGTDVVVGVSGDVSDMQFLSRHLDQLIKREEYEHDGHVLQPEHVKEYLSRYYYNRRSRFDPLWNTIIIAGYNRTEHKPVLTQVDLRGTTFSASTLASGFGQHLAQPILRHYEPTAPQMAAYPSRKLPKLEARQVIDECMKVLFYRDARSINKFSVAYITADGIEWEKDQTIKADFSFAEKVKGYGAQNV